MRFKNLSLRAPVPPQVRELKIMPQSHRKAPPIPKAAPIPQFIRKKDSGKQGVLAQLMDQQPRSPGPTSSEQDVRLGKKASSQQYLPVLQQAPSTKSKVLMVSSSQATQCNDQSYTRQGNIFYPAVSNRQDRNRVYQSVHAEGGSEVRGQLGKLRGVTRKVSDRDEQAVQRLDGVQRLIR